LTKLFTTGNGVRWHWAMFFSAEKWWPGQCPCIERGIAP